MNAEWLLFVIVGTLPRAQTALSVRCGGPVLSCRPQSLPRPPTALLRAAGRRRAADARCCEAPPPDLDGVCEQVRQCVTEAVLAGKRSLTVDAGMSSLDVQSRGFDPPVFARFALEISQALVPVLDGPLLLLLPGMAAVAAARELIDNEAVWPSDAEVRVSSVGAMGAPRPGDAPPAAVIIGGLTGAADADDPSYGHARAWLKAAPIAMCINARVKVPPVELAGSEPAYHLMTYTVAKSDLAEENMRPEDAGSAVLWRRFPAAWRVLLDTGNAGDWSLVAELERKPTEEQMTELLLPTMERRQAAMDSARSALGEGLPGALGTGMGALAAGREVAPGGGGGGSSAGATSTTGGRDTSDGVVCLTWADTQAPQAFGPLALYGAVALHRLRLLKEDACLDSERMKRGVHVLLPTVVADVAAASQLNYPKLRGDLVGACQLVADGGGAELAYLEQLAIKADATAEQAQALLERATREASMSAQRAILLPCVVAEPGSPIEAWLAQAGFARAGDPAADELPADVAAAVAEMPGSLYKLLPMDKGTRSEQGAPSESSQASRLAAVGDEGAEDAAMEEAAAEEVEAAMAAASDEPPPPSSRDEDDERGGGLGLLDGPQPAAGADVPSTGDEPASADEGFSPPSDEDIARLKRMFGSAD